VVSIYRETVPNLLEGKEKAEEEPLSEVLSTPSLEVSREEALQPQQGKDT